MNTSNKVKVTAIQMDCVLNDKEENKQKAKALIYDAAKEGAKLIVLPELFSTGYRVEENDPELAETIPGGTISWMEQCAIDTKTYLVAAILESASAKGIIYDTAVLVGPNGFIGSYRKTHLWDQENVRFTKGIDFPVFETEIGNIGLQICYEIGFPEGARILVRKGADILVYPSAFGKARLYAWDIASRARALENGSFVIASNRIGQDKDAVFGGHSRIVNPQGNVLAEKKNGEGMVMAEIDLKDVIDQRRTIPYLRDLNESVIYQQFRNL